MSALNQDVVSSFNSGGGWKRLVSTLEGRDGLALSLIQSTSLNSTVAELDLAVGLLLPGESVLHPVLVITVREILTGVGTTRLLTVGGGGSSLGTIR